MTSWLVDNLGPTVAEREAAERERDARWRHSSYLAALDRELRGVEQRIMWAADGVAEARAAVKSAEPHWRSERQAELDVLLRRVESWQSQVAAIKAEIKRVTKAGPDGR